MKRGLKSLLAAGIGLGAAGVVAVGMVALSDRALSDHATIDACAGRPAGVDHAVTILHDKLSATAITGQLCDRLTITNRDAEQRLIAFGAHDDHQAYDGVTERVLGQNDNLTITLNQPGTFTFHDHLHDKVVGSFTVVQP